MFIGPIFVGTMSDLTGLDMGFWMIGLIGFIGAILKKIYSKGSIE